MLVAVGLKNYRHEEKYLITQNISPTHPQLDPVLGLLVLDDGSHLEVVFEGAGDVVGCLAGLDAALDARSHLLLA